MNHHDGCWLDHVAMDTLQFLPGPLVNAPQLLVLLIRYPQPVLEYGEVKGSPWMNGSNGKDGWSSLSASRWELLFILCHIIILNRSFCSYKTRVHPVINICVTQASPTWFSNRTRRSEPSRAAVSTTPLLWSHQNRRSSVKSMVRPLGDSRLVLAMTVRSFPSSEALSTTGWAPISVQNNFLKW